MAEHGVLDNAYVKINTVDLSDKVKEIHCPKSIAAQPDTVMGDDTESDDDRTFHRVDRGSVYEWIHGVPFGIHHLDVRVSGAGVVLHHLSFGTTDVPEEE